MTFGAKRLKFITHRNALPLVFEPKLYVSFNIRDIISDPDPGVHNVDLVVLRVLTPFELSIGSWLVNANVQKLSVLGVIPVTNFKPSLTFLSTSSSPRISCIHP